MRLVGGGAFGFGWGEWFGECREVGLECRELLCVFTERGVVGVYKTLLFPQCLVECCQGGLHSFKIRDVIGGWGVQVMVICELVSRLFQVV